MEIRERKQIREQERDVLGEDGRRVLEMQGQGQGGGQGLSEVLERGQERRGGIRGNELGLKSERVT